MSNLRYFFQSVILSVVLSAVLLMLISPAVGLTADNKDIPVEGIVADKNPELSIAVINGEFYKKGSHYQDYEITEIRSDRVIAKDKSGNLSEHRFKITPPPIQTTQTKNESVTSPLAVNLQSETDAPTPSTAPASPLSWLEALQQFMQKQGWNFDIAGILNYTREISAIAEMRKLSTQAHVAIMDSDGEFMTLKDMIEKGRVDPTFGGLKNGFKFRIDSDEHGIRIYADPEPSGVTRKHFMIDSWGNLHAEKGRPATVKSPLAETPSLPFGLITPHPKPTPSADESH